VFVILPKLAPVLAPDGSADILTVDVPTFSGFTKIVVRSVNAEYEESETLYFLFAEERE